LLIEKILRSSNKLLCYYKNIPNHPFYEEELDLPFQISAIFLNKDINEANADKLLNTVITTKIINVPVEEENTEDNGNDNIDNNNENDDANANEANNSNENPNDNEIDNNSSDTATTSTINNEQSK